MTYDYNYRRFGQILGIDLLGNPDLALDRKIGAKIICKGMYDGLFTSKGLRDYFSDGRRDFYNARLIVNFMDKPQEFADRAIRIMNA